MAKLQSPIYNGILTGLSEGKHIEIIRIKPFYNKKKRQYLPQYLSDKGSKCTIANGALPSLH